MKDNLTSHRDIVSSLDVSSIFNSFKASSIVLTSSSNIELEDEENYNTY